MLRKLKTCTQNFSGWPLWKHGGAVSHSLGIRNHHDNCCNPMTPHHLCLQGTRGRGAPPSSTSTLFWSCRTFSSGLGEHLALCPPACRTALPAVKERGAGVSQGGRVGLEQHHALHAGASLGQVMQLRQPSRAGFLPYGEPSKEPRRVRHTHSQGPQKGFPG